MSLFKKKQPLIKSLIAHGTRLDGLVSFSEGMRIDGEVHGNIQAQGEVPSLLVISESAQVHGEIRADHIIINGHVNGPVHALAMLELQPKARIHGDVHYRALDSHQGALIAGQLKPMDEVEKPTLKLAANNL
jgi:cytoskeletal protein CcmA (bactofilin family)